MWMPTKSEAVEMYARFWASRYGQTASVSARGRAASFKMNGDTEGHKVWVEVAEAIDYLVKNKCGPTYQETVIAASLNKI
jgi:hypothetical protein